jgi:hypothetical protein
MGISGTPQATTGIPNVPWTAYSPTLTNVTLGTGGAISAAYARIGRTILFRIRIVLGTGGALTGTMTATLPVAATADHFAGNHLIGHCTYADATGGTFYGPAELNTATTLRPRALGSAGTWANQDLINATQPFTWAVSDVLTINGAYEAAA